MTTTLTPTPGSHAAGEHMWGKSVSDDNPDFWAISEPETHARRDSYWAGLPDEPALPGQAARAEARGDRLHGHGEHGAGEHGASGAGDPDENGAGGAEEHGDCGLGGVSLRVVSVAGEELLAQLKHIRDVLADVPAGLPVVSSSDLARLVAEATAVVAVAECGSPQIVEGFGLRGVRDGRCGGLLVVDG